MQKQWCYSDKLIYLFSFKNKKLKKYSINNSLEDEMLVNINIAPKYPF